MLLPKQKNGQAKGFEHLWESPNYDGKTTDQSGQNISKAAALLGCCWSALVIKLIALLQLDTNAVKDPKRTAGLTKLTNVLLLRMTSVSFKTKLNLRTWPSRFLYTTSESANTNMNDTQLEKNNQWLVIKRSLSCMEGTTKLTRESWDRIKEKVTLHKCVN